MLRRMCFAAMCVWYTALYKVGYALAASANALGVLGPVNRFGWWLYEKDRLVSFEAGIHDGVMREWYRL